VSDAILDSVGQPPDRTVAYGADPSQVVDLRGADGAPLVVVIHGGYWRPATDRRHAGRMSDALAAAGFRVATIEYRRIPGDPDATVADVRAAIAAVGGTPVLLGHSAGGHLALLLAADPGVRGVVALAPVADLALAEARGLGSGAVAAFLGGVPRPDLDPARLPEPPVPVTILHGAADRVVPREVAEAYARTHPAARLEVLPRAGHFEVIDPDAEEWPAVVAALRSHT
jgi:pimeloyl-ACP methyl ester carboxylesterase